MRKEALIFLVVAVALAAMAGFTMECRARGVQDSSLHIAMNAVLDADPAPPPLCSEVELPGLQKDVNGAYSRYVITNQTSSLATLWHAYYDNTGNPVGSQWTSEIGPSGSQTYDLAEIDSLPDGYTGHGIVQSDAQITGTVLPPLYEMELPGLQKAVDGPAYPSESGP